MPWCQILIDDPAEDERTFLRLMRSVPAVGDLLDVDKEEVTVTSVSRIPPRPNGRRSPSVLVYCRLR